MRLGQILKLYRAHLRLSTRAMAEKLGVNHMTVSRMENGEGIDLATFQKVLNFLLDKADYFVVMTPDVTKDNTENWHPAPKCVPVLPPYGGREEA